MTAMAKKNPDEADGFETYIISQMEDVGQRVSGTPDLLTW
jgi:hypothetical protein